MPFSVTYWISMLKLSCRSCLWQESFFQLSALTCRCLLPQKTDSSYKHKASECDGGWIVLGCYFHLVGISIKPGSVLIRCQNDIEKGNWGSGNTFSQFFTSPIDDTCSRCQEPIQRVHLASPWTLCIWLPFWVLLLISLATFFSPLSLSPALARFHSRTLWCNDWCSCHQVRSSTLCVIPDKILIQTSSCACYSEGVGTCLSCLIDPFVELPLNRKCPPRIPFWVSRPSPIRKACVLNHLQSVSCRPQTQHLETKSLIPSLSLYLCHFLWPEGIPVLDLLLSWSLQGMRTLLHPCACALVLGQSPLAVSLFVCGDTLWAWHRTGCSYT